MGAPIALLLAMQLCVEPPPPIPSNIDQHSARADASRERVGELRAALRAISSSSRRRYSNRREPPPGYSPSPGSIPPSRTNTLPFSSPPAAFYTRNFQPSDATESPGLEPGGDANHYDSATVGPHGYELGTLGLDPPRPVPDQLFLNPMTETVVDSIESSGCDCAASHGENQCCPLRCRGSGLCQRCHGHGIHSHRALKDWLFSTAEMPLHINYILLEPDTYYFRPYNLVHIAQQQHMVTAWGGDPRHPYANELFERVYQEWEADQAEPELVPAPEQESEEFLLPNPDDEE